VLVLNGDFAQLEHYFTRGSAQSSALTYGGSNTGAQGDTE
jgi:hypothetical protein